MPDDSVLRAALRSLSDQYGPRDVAHTAADLTQPTMPTDDLRDQYAEAMRQAFGHAITAEWICCDPPNPRHDLCQRGHAAREMVAALLTDDEHDRSPILDALTAVRDNELERLRGEIDRLADYGLKHRERAEQAEAERDEALTNAVELVEDRAKALVELDDARAERNVLIDEVKTLQKDLEGFGEAQKAWLRFRRERDALKAAIKRAQERLQAALDAWEIEHEYNRDRARRKGYTHNQTAAEAYGDAIKAATEALAALDAPETATQSPANGRTGDHPTTDTNQHPGNDHNAPE